MTITFTDGSQSEALLLSWEAERFRAALAGEEEERVFTWGAQGWQDENGEPVQVKLAWEKDSVARNSDEVQFIYPQDLGRQVISKLMKGIESYKGPAPLYVFSGDKRRVHIRVLHPGQLNPSSGSPLSR